MKHLPWKQYWLFPMIKNSQDRKVFISNFFWSQVGRAMCCNRWCVLAGWLSFLEHRKSAMWTDGICDLQRVSLCSGLHECRVTGDGGHVPSLNYTTEENHEKLETGKPESAGHNSFIYKTNCTFVSHFWVVFSLHHRCVCVCVVLGCRILIREGLPLF